MNTPRVRPHPTRTARARQTCACRARAATTNDDLLIVCRDLYARGHKLNKVLWYLRALPNGEDRYWSHAPL